VAEDGEAEAGHGACEGDDDHFVWSLLFVFVLELWFWDPWAVMELVRSNEERIDWSRCTPGSLFRRTDR
jgi:hypothetical protein